MSQDQTHEEMVTDWRIVKLAVGIGVGCLVALASLLTWLMVVAPDRPIFPAPVAKSQDKDRSRVVVYPATKRQVPLTEKEIVPPPKPSSKPKRVVPVVRVDKEEARPQPKKETRQEVVAKTELTDAIVPEEPESPYSTFYELSFLNEKQLHEMLEKQASELDSGINPSKRVLMEEFHEPQNQNDLRSARFLLEHLKDREDLKGLPFRKGESCQIDEAAAKNLAGCAGELHRQLLLINRNKESARNASGDLSYSLSYSTKRKKNWVGVSKVFVDRLENWLKPKGVPALVQVLQASDAATRNALVVMLSKIKGSQASTALAKRALFDTDEDIRIAALRALKKRPKSEYRDVLLDGLRYSWTPIANHAADALVGVQDHQSIPQLVEMLDFPDPTAPTNDNGTWTVLELVRVNHLRNCFLCHAVSVQRSDPVRGLVPSPRLPISRQCSGIFVRADITYIRQDFSVMHSVKNHKPWPEMQRFDYFIRRRPISKEEAQCILSQKDSNYPQRESVHFALCRLLGRDAGKESKDWRRLIKERGKLKE